MTALARLALYPPIMGPTDQQLEDSTLFGEPLPASSTFFVPSLSPSFVAKYGRAIHYHRAFARLMRASFPASLVPKYKIDFVELAKKISFLDFCKKSDERAVQKGVAVLDRPQLEGAWVQELFWKFDQMMEKKEAAMQIYGKEDEGKFDEWVKVLLKKAVNRRFQRWTEGVEEYWAGKKAMYPQWDISSAWVPDNFGEPKALEEGGTMGEDVEMDVDDEGKNDGDIEGKNDEDEDMMDVDVDEIPSLQTTLAFRAR